MRAVPQKRPHVNVASVAIDQSYINFSGGYDTDTPAIEKAPGVVISAQNCEQATNGGYVWMTGYERHDGKVKPSAAIYHVLTADITGTLNNNNVLTDNAGTSFGTVIARTSTTVILTLLTGSFSTGNVKVGAVIVGTCVGAQAALGAPTPLLGAQYKNLAADAYRALILAVPGSGILRGIWAYSPNTATNDLYAFRDNAAGTFCEMYKRTSTGWSLVALNEEISFSNANTSVGDADVLTQGAVTATINRVVVQTGTLQSGVNTGRLIISGRLGGSFGAGAATSSGGGALTLSAIQTAITLVTGGQYNFITETFGGGANTPKVYGADSKNRGFEFNGTTFVPIISGMSPDTPRHVYQHKNHLFYSFLGSAQHSGLGTPYVHTAIAGAAELAMGDTITGFMRQSGSSTEAALTVFTRNTLATIYGSGSTTWQIIQYKQEAGAIDRTVQQVSNTLMLDDRGLVFLEAVKEYGNFKDITLSQKIQSWLSGKKGLVTCSCIMRDKNQYRIFFSDKTALFVTIKSGKIVGMMPIKTAHVVHCITSVEDSTGKEVAYFGDENGMVHQMESGTSFDGEPIEAYLELAFNNLKNPTQLKQYKNTVLEVAGGGYSEFDFSYKIGYGSSNLSQAVSATHILSLQNIKFGDAGVQWGQSYTWGGAPLLPIRLGLGGTAENISLKFSMNSDYFAPATFNGAMLQFIPRRLQR